MRSLFLAIPVLAALLASLVWWLVGRALGPVESIRREVAAISGRSIWDYVLSGDEDYELLFTAPPEATTVRRAANRRWRSCLAAVSTSR